MLGCRPATIASMMAGARRVRRRIRLRYEALTFSAFANSAEHEYSAASSLRRQRCARTIDVSIVASFGPSGRRRLCRILAFFGPAKVWLAMSVLSLTRSGHNVARKVGFASSKPLRYRLLNFGADMRRREFIRTLVGAVTAWPLRAYAQQTMPLVGFLNSASPDTYRFNADSFREGLAKAGFVEGRNVRIEERWALGDYGALPNLAAEFVTMGVAAIAATGDVASAHAAQLASSRVPVVFTIGGDPIRHGLVRAINRPGGHVTGILFNQNVLAAKRVATAWRNCPKGFPHRTAHESRQSQCQNRGSGCGGRGKEAGP